MFSAKSRPAAMAIACFWISLLLTTAPTPADEAAAPRDAAAGKTTPPAPQTPPKTPTQTPFDYDYYEELMAPVPDHEQERLCGLDKVCMTLWKKGKLQLYKEGRLFVSDFNQDGIKDEAVILEKDEPDFPEDKDYLISITTKQNGVRKLLLHEVIPNANNVIEVLLDKEKNALVIDTGGRIIRTPETISFPDDPIYGTSKTLKLVVVVIWNPKTNKFDLLTPTLTKVPRSKIK